MSHSNFTPNIHILWTNQVCCNNVDILVKSMFALGNRHALLNYQNWVDPKRFSKWQTKLIGADDTKGLGKLPNMISMSINRFLQSYMNNVSCTYVCNFFKMFFFFNCHQGRKKELGDGFDLFSVPHQNYMGGPNINLLCKQA